MSVAQWPDIVSPGCYATVDLPEVTHLLARGHLGEFAFGQPQGKQL